MRKHKVPDGVSPMPLLQYMRRAFPRIPAALIKETLRKRDIRVDGVKSDGQVLVYSGNELTIYLDEKYLTAPLCILYEDENILAVDKPAGIPMDSDSASVGADTLCARLKEYCPKALPAHRLDTGTGGVLLASKTVKGHQRLLAAFKEHQIEKTYCCLVKGTPSPQQARKKAFLIKDASASRVRIVERAQPGALTIETGYRLLEQRGDISLLEIHLITGRTHQIRAHMSYLGYPLLGDDKYGDRAFNRKKHATQIALWCTRLVYDGMTFVSPAPFAQT